MAVINKLFWLGFLIAIYVVIKNHTHNTEQRLSTAVAEATVAYAVSLEPYSRYFNHPDLATIPALKPLQKRSNQLKTRFILPPYDVDAMTAAHDDYKSLYTYASKTELKDAFDILIAETAFQASHYTRTVALYEAFKATRLYHFFN